MDARRGCEGHRLAGDMLRTLPAPLLTMTAAPDPTSGHMLSCKPLISSITEESTILQMLQMQKLINSLKSLLTQRHLC